MNVRLHRQKGSTMTHEPCPEGPEGGYVGEAWLDDAADADVQPLPDVPVGDLR